MRVRCSYKNLQWTVASPQIATITLISFMIGKTNHLAPFPNTEKARPNLWIILGSWESC